ncbi:hypothetical protein [Acinetobacter sp. NIPH 298]|uniref:hypothetical protein n=1 Tax=Acinetobacter sp. NIPH 298 TaxID=1217692 RepID=UPI0002CF7611|nr:hypothetical protein [Acinetobacter sp. NIPH 298]ENW94927.1 hypothetical protein F903_02603 [Acinetobacter sp. NIPH 298]
MENRNNIFDWVFIVGLIGSVLIISGCETEQSASKSNNAMVGYTQDYANAQADFINQEQLKKSSITEMKAVTDGSPQSLRSQN